MTDEIRYVEHPRYGNTPNFTGLNPDPLDPEVELNWNSKSLDETAAKFELLYGKKLPNLEMLRAHIQQFGGSELASKERIPNTAILADPTKYKVDQIFADFTHYFDLQRQCRSCRKLFVFYAEEQKYWYEVLQFSLEADAVRCVPCRKRKQRTDWQRRRYEALSHTKPRLLTEDLEMAECACELLGRRLGTKKLRNRVKGLLNHVQRTGTEPELLDRATKLADRLDAIAELDR